MMQRRDGLTAAATDRYRLVTTRDACILVELDTHRNAYGASATGRATTLDAVHHSRPHHIIRVMLDGVKVRDVRKLTGRHAAMKAEANDDRPPVRQALIQRSQRGNKVEASRSVRDADGGAVECGPAAQGPGWVLCCTNSHVRATQKGSVEINGGHQGSSHELVMGS